MANPSPISIADQAKIIQETLNDWAFPRGGAAKIVPNLKQLFIQSAQDTQSLRILISFAGCKPRSPFSRSNATHRDDVMWKIAVTKGEAPTAERGEFLTQSTGNTDPFLAEVETVRDILRWIPNISQEAPANDYYGIEPLTVNDTQMSGYMITISTAHDLPQPVSNQAPI